MSRTDERETTNGNTISKNNKSRLHRKRKQISCQKQEERKGNCRKIDVGKQKNLIRRFIAHEIIQYGLKKIKTSRKKSIAANVVQSVFNNYGQGNFFVKKNGAPIRDCR